MNLSKKGLPFHVEELSNVNVEEHFIKKLIKKIKILNEYNLKLILEEEFRHLSFNLEDL